MQQHKSWGYIAARPTDHVVHSRRGKIRRQGMGLSFFCLPVIDRYCMLSTVCSRLAFAADQITRENQGVEISGFAVWKVGNGEATCQRFDFDGAQDPLAAIGDCLKDVVESAIRHRIANMTIEDVLRKRATLILELKQELAYITAQWGLELDTIEIKNVRILSGSVFAHLQARYRDTLKLEAETSAIETEKVIQERRLKQQREMAEQSHAFELRQAELKKAARLVLEQHRQETESARLDTEADLKARAGQQELAHQERLCAGRVRLQASEQKALVAERQTHRARHQTAREAAEQASALAELQAADLTRRIAAENGASPVLAFIRSLPQTAQALQINEVNLGDAALQQALRLLTRSLTGDPPRVAAATSP